MRGDWPSIDHSLLSPSGRMSKRARAAAVQREGARIFAGVGDLLASPVPQPSPAQRLRRQARLLRELADRGMCTRSYRRQAAKLEAEAERLESAP